MALEKQRIRYSQRNNQLANQLQKTRFYNQTDEHKAAHILFGNLKRKRNKGFSA
jgi:hypothetical protein